ncbi:cysteinyl leukotriene receptor 1-like [Lineus longissimus]|uniref:cysteinyl leukotriene receptor 1-like n=1 Tax=Lineus longissimus TaxID=88925 RepID=UPI00315D7CD8
MVTSTGYQNVTTSQDVSMSQTADPSDILDALLYYNSSYLTPILVIFGVINNLLVLVVMSLPQYRKHVSCLYLRALAVFDIINLLGIGTVLTKNVMVAMIARYGDPFCAALSFCSYFSPNASSWVIIAITFTRFVAVMFPLKAHLITTFKAANIYIAVTVIAFCVWASPSLVFSKAPKGESTRAFRCVLLIPVSVNASYEMAHSILALMLPFFVLLVLNLSIMNKMNRRNKSVERMTVSATDTKEERSVIVMVFGVTIAFLVLVLPYVIQTIVWQVLLAYKELNPYQIKQRNFSYTMASMFYATNCSINFFLYFITCRKFRQDFKSVILCECLLAQKG